MSDQLSPLAELSSATSPKQSLELLTTINTEMGDVAGELTRIWGRSHSPISTTAPGTTRPAFQCRDLDLLVDTHAER